MTVSFGLFRQAVRDPGYRTVAGGAKSVAITPIGTFRKAICTYHQAGRQAALDGISLPSRYWRTDPRGKTLAGNYRSSLETYFKLDTAEPGRAYDAGIRRPVAIGGEILNVYIDALVYAPAGHAARIALWDVPVPDSREASIMASPIIEALREAVGEERARSVAFWHLRSATLIRVEAETALAQAFRAADAVRRAAGS
jgi:hypothetical protein